jgi:nucleoside-diphosphate-sugar epimerase
MILLTGAPGFFGVHATKILLESGKRVLALGTSPFPEAAREYFSRHDQTNLTSIQCDISNQQNVLDVFEKYSVEMVIHAATVTILGEMERHKERYITGVNAIGTLNLLEASRAKGVSRFVFVSSSGLYGTHGRGVAPVHETTPIYPGTASGVYLACKVYSEMLCQAFHQFGDLEAVIARLGSPYGPWERPTRSRKGMSVIYQLMALAVAGTKARVYGRDVMRDWTHMRDIARAIVGLAMCDQLQLKHRIYNVTSGVNLSIEHVLQALKCAIPQFDYEFVDSEASANILAMPASSRGPLDVSRLREDLGYEPEFSVETGVADYAEWAKNNKDLML